MSPRKPAASPSSRGGPTRTRETPTTQTVYSLGEQETFDLGRAIGRNLKGGEMILLEGDLGLGKTVLAKGIAAGLGIPPEDVNSPSFTLVQEYRSGRLTLFHVDLYRLGDDEEIASLGLEDLVDTGAVVVVEWGERLPAIYRRQPAVIRLHDLGEGSRRIELIGSAPSRPAGDGDA